MDSILDTIKKMLGIDATDTAFDTDLIIHINSIFGVLNQLGVGPESTFSISDNNETWSDFLETSADLEQVKSYIFLKIKLLFDPPSNSFTIDAFNRQASEFEWRLTIPKIDSIPEE